MNDELKACPKCEGVNIYLDDALGFRYSCNGCGYSPDWWGDSEKVAAAYWNTRPIEDGLRKERDEARAWARRMMRERDEALESLRKEISKVNYTFQLGVIDPSKARRWWIE